MSQVYERNRSLSQYQFYMTALDIYVEVTKLCHSERVLPKSRRFTHAVPLTDLARSLVSNVVTSDSFYPNTAHNVLMRRHYLTLAVADAKMLATEFGLLPRMGIDVSVNRFEELAGLIDREIGLLKGARKNVRLIGRRSVEQEISDLRERLDELLEVQSEAVTP